MEFLKEFDIRLAKDDIFANILPNMLELTDYEEAYMSKEEIKRRGFQGVASANLMGLSSQHILDDFVFNHPVFGKSKMHTILNYVSHTVSIISIQTVQKPYIRKSFVL